MTEVPHHSPVEMLAELVSDAPAPRPFAFAVALSADREAIGLLRHDLADLLRKSGLEHLTDEFVLGAQELMANAVVHGCRRVHDSTIAVSVNCDGQRIRFKVQDPSDDQPRVRVAADDEMNGRGMLIVEAFADRWGVEAPSDGVGKSVWMEMSCTPASSPGVA
ncbi:ATP-binding protein [Streptomyces sp. NBC_01433]|uniref:ATP-binding protein n=1 Tax=Streptomyces sp. NBC_01433 TaxID=2903864 RepID=UPI00224E2E39|nr:ATP-binding protein [Streptomyces sp. NBC_01433]MCX4681450.1 ATP-binding protein [Streptomyces sp. NBC_01433]